MLVSNTYFKGVHYQLLLKLILWQQFSCSMSAMFKLVGKSIVKTKLLGKLLVEIFPELWPPFHSFKIFMILITYLFTWSLSLICSALVEHLIFVFFLIQLCLQYWTKYNLVRKKNVHLISKINLRKKKTSEIKKRVTKFGIELDKKV